MFRTLRSRLTGLATATTLAVVCLATPASAPAMTVEVGTLEGEKVCVLEPTDAELDRATVYKAEVTGAFRDTVMRIRDTADQSLATAIADYDGGADPAVARAALAAAGYNDFEIKAVLAAKGPDLMRNELLQGELAPINATLAGYPATAGLEAARLLRDSNGGLATSDLLYPISDDLRYSHAFRTQAQAVERPATEAAAQLLEVFSRSSLSAHWDECVRQLETRDVPETTPPVRKTTTTAAPLPDGQQESALQFLSRMSVLPGSGALLVPMLGELLALLTLPR